MFSWRTHGNLHILNSYKLQIITVVWCSYDTELLFRFAWFYISEVVSYPPWSFLWVSSDPQDKVAILSRLRQKSFFSRSFHAAFRSVTVFLSARCNVFIYVAVYSCAKWSDVSSSTDEPLLHSPNFSQQPSAYLFLLPKTHAQVVINFSLVSFSVSQYSFFKQITKQKWKSLSAWNKYSQSVKY